MLSWGGDVAALEADDVDGAAEGVEGARGVDDVGLGVVEGVDSKSSSCGDGAAGVSAPGETGASAAGASGAVEFSVIVFPS